MIFLKQIAKFAYLFDFESNFETSSDNDPDYNNWRQRTQTLIAENNVRIIHRHVLLIRDPLAVLGSWMGKSGNVHKNNIHPEEVGIVQLLDVYSKVMGSTLNNNKSNGAIVIDSDDLASQPATVLKQLCASLNVDYRESMLRWKVGKHQCDGPWAKWWYHDVWGSSGWDAAVEDRINDENSGVNHPRTKRYKTVPPKLLPVLRISYPAYEFLKTCTLSYKNRAIATTPSGKLFEDPRNENVLVYVGSSSGPTGGNIVPREMAGLSPFDSSVQGGDGKYIFIKEDATHAMNFRY